MIELFSSIELDLVKNAFMNSNECKKLINLCRNINPNGHEDANICIRYRDSLESHGCVFAPVDVAMKFSLEEQIPECEFNLNNTFGFHGRGDPNMDPSRGHYQQFLDRIKLLETL
jgi:hypothetical protein